MDSRTDAELVARVVGGDVEAFAPIVHRYRDAYARYAARILGDRDEAEDVLQSAFVRAFRNLGSCRNPERLGSWLFQIVINECRTFAMRRSNRDRRIVRDDLVLGQVPAPLAPEPDVLPLEIQRALDRLSPDHREAFVLKHVEQMEYDEIARLTGVGVSALKMRVKRACDQLREELAGVAYDG